MKSRFAEFLTESSRCILYNQLELHLKETNILLLRTGDFRKISPIRQSSWMKITACILQIMGVTSQQEEGHLSETLSQGEVLWEKILQVYRSAEDAGALSKISSSPQDLRDDATNLRFVLQVAENLKDKPKHTSGKKFK